MTGIALEEGSHVWCSWCDSYHPPDFDCSQVEPQMRMVEIVDGSKYVLVRWSDYGGMKRHSFMKRTEIIDGAAFTKKLRERMVAVVGPSLHGT